MIDLDKLIEWHQNELRHINAALLTEKPSRARKRWEQRRAGHERTVQELLRLRSIDGMRELQQESEAMGLYDTPADQPPAAMSAEEHCRMFCAWKGGGPCLADDCPRRAESQPPAAVHNWTGPKGAIKWDHCTVCGVIRRHDGRNSAECKGAPSISTRTDKSTPGAK